VARVKASTGNQTPGIVLGIVGNKLVDFGTEADDFGSNVVDQGGAIDAAVVEVIEEGPRRAAILLDLVQIGAVALDQFERLRLEAGDRIDVNVAVGDQGAAPGFSFNTTGFWDLRCGPSRRFLRA
jgi:hypothetical protein